MRVEKVYIDKVDALKHLDSNFLKNLTWSFHRPIFRLYILPLINL